MNFNLDDPLADLLSDNSNDNDSFFDNQTGKKKNPTSKPSTSTGRTTGGGGKGKLEDLFGIKEESEPQFKVPPIRTTFNAVKRDDKPVASSTPKVKESFDILTDLGFDPKNPKSSAAPKSSLFDDILGPIDTKKQSSSGKMEELVVRRDDNIMATRATLSRQSTETTDNSGVTTGLVRPKTSTGRRSSTASPAKHNTLDLFSRETDVLRVPTPKARKKGSTADWLGLGNESDEEQPPNVKETTTPGSVPKVEVLKINDEETVEPENSTAPIVEPEAALPPEISNPSVTNLMAASNIGTQNAAHIIDQQVSQLALANQMKNQEGALMEMQRRQYELISRQEAQFNELLQKQIVRQSHLEQTIKAQQERINSHIQLLLSQPVNSSPYPAKDFEKDEQKNSNSNEKADELIELQADVKRLELEKLRLENLVSTINANYENEIELIEKSFRKQIEVLEENLTVLETRLKKENEALHEFYTTKLQAANNEKIEIQTRLEGILTELRKSHDEEIRKLKSAHEEDMDGIKDDHRKMIETIRQSKLFEFAAVQENGSYLETLRTASHNLETVSGNLQTLRTEMERKIDIIHREREAKLELREKKLDASERKLQFMESSNEAEKKRLMDLVATLESQLNQITKESSEENWIMRQQMAALEAEKLTFEKEKLLAREQIAKDEKRIDELKENQLNELKRQMEQVQEERAKLGVEKAKIETAKKLESSFALEQSRQEVEASLKVAQDVTRQAEAERDRLFKLQRQFEAQKRALADKENTMRFREQELEQDILQARASERRANETTQKARLSEQNFNEKVAFLQQKMKQLSEKESRLSQERLQLAQERIDLQNLKSNLEQNRCSLCRIGERNGELSQVLRSVSRISNGIPMIDDQQFINEHTRDVDVDRLLDENVAISLERLKNSSHRDWTEQERLLDPNSIGFDFSKYAPTSDLNEN